jgi:DNA-binding MarR family transcriptional regulator
LRDRGLEAGDDAVLFLLGETNGLTAQRLAEGVGVEPGALELRIERLIARDLVCRRDVGADAAPGLALTPRGERVRIALEHAWASLDSMLLGGLEARERRRLNRALKHVLTLLR